MKMRAVSALLLTGMMAVALPVHASPWLDAGDRRLREDVELLKDYGLLTGPVNDWPLPWAPIADALETADLSTLPRGVRNAVSRVRQAVEQAQAQSLTRVRLGVTNQPALVRDFGASGRESVDAGASIEQDFGRFFVRLGGGYRLGQEGRDVHLEDSFAALSLGGWALYAGYVDHWWGPGMEGALALSTSARPVPQIGIRRLENSPINLPVLRWLGPWRFEAFIGKFLEDRSDFDDPLLIGMRLSLEPIPGLEIAANRGLQICGEGRPCDARIFRDALLPTGFRDNSGTFDEPGNQIAGFDVRYGRRVGPVTLSLYGEMIGEDGDGYVVEQVSLITGAAVAGTWGEGRWRVGFEYGDTEAMVLKDPPGSYPAGTRRVPGSTYNNFIFSQGYTYRHDPLGFSLDGDARLWSLVVTGVDGSDRWGKIALRRARLNVNNEPLYRVSQTPESLWIGELAASVPTRYGEVGVETRLESDRPNTPGDSDVAARVKLNWQHRF